MPIDDLLPQATSQLWVAAQHRQRVTAHYLARELAACIAAEEAAEATPPSVAALRAQFQQPDVDLPQEVQTCLTEWAPLNALSPGQGQPGQGRPVLPLPDLTVSLVC